jgi:hypothetical protein
LPLRPLRNPERLGGTPIQCKPGKTEYRLRDGSLRHFGRSTLTVVKVDGDLLNDQSLARKTGDADHEKAIAIGVNRFDQTWRNEVQPDSTKGSRVLGYREPQNQAGDEICSVTQKTPPTPIIGSSAGAEPGTDCYVDAGVQSIE